MTWPHPSTHPTTHPPTKPHTHPWVGNSSQISNLQMELKYLDKLKCYRILSDSGGPPPGGGRWVDGGGGGYGCVWGCPMHACMHMHAHTCMYMHVKHAKHAKHGCLHVGGHLQFLYMYKCACVYVHACACMCTCVGTPPCPQMPPHPPVPSPELQGAQNTKNSISPELIEIIRFCLKILYLWTFLNSYIL